MGAQMLEMLIAVQASGLFKHMAFEIKVWSWSTNKTQGIFVGLVICLQTF